MAQPPCWGIIFWIKIYTILMTPLVTQAASYHITDIAFVMFTVCYTIGRTGSLGSCRSICSCRAMGRCGGTCSIFVIVVFLIYGTWPPGRFAGVTHGPWWQMFVTLFQWDLRGLPGLGSAFPPNQSISPRHQKRNTCPEVKNRKKTGSAYSKYVKSM